MRVPRGFTHLSMMVPVNIVNISKNKKKGWKGNSNNSKPNTYQISTTPHWKYSSIICVYSITDYIRLTQTREQDLVSDMVTGLEYNCKINYKLVMKML